ncbi:unnamed protein product [Mucor hiemalis]
MNLAVPAIEDYIIPKRTSFASQRQDVTTVTPSQRMPPPPRTPPLNPTFHPRGALPAFSDIHHRHPPPPSSSSLPPQPQQQRFDPLFDYRSNTTQTPPSTTLKPVALPPIVAPRPIPLNNPYEELSDFDEAMTKLERLRRRVPPEQSKVLSRLTSSLEDIVQQAEYILLNTQQQHESTTHYRTNSSGISHNHRL